MTEVPPIPIRRVTDLPQAGTLQPTDLLLATRPGNPANPILVPLGALAGPAETVAAAELVRRLIAPGLLAEDGSRMLAEGGETLLLEGTLPIDDAPSFEQAFNALPAGAALAGTEPVPVLQSSLARTVTADDIARRAVEAGIAAAALHHHDDDDLREHYARVYGGRGPDDEGNVAVITLNTAQPHYALSGADLGRTVRVVNAGCFLRCDTLPLNEGSVDVDVQPGANLLLWAGDQAGVLWRAQGEKMLLAASGSILRIRRGQNDGIVTVDAGSVAISAASPPVPAAVRIPLGQSWPSLTRGTRHWLEGMQAQRAAILAAGLEPGLSRYVQNLAGATFGASSASKGGATIATNYWYDDETASAGPNLTAAIANVLASIAANPGIPSAEAIICQLGANDFPVFSAAGRVTIPILAANYAAIAAGMRTGLGLASLPFMIIPTCSFDSTPIDPRKQYPQRRAQLDAGTLSAHNWRGPDCYDIPHPKDDAIHHSFVGMAELGRRIEQFLARRRGVNVYLGPKIMGFERIGTRAYLWTINRFGGLPTAGLNPEPMQTPAAPLGFAVMPAGDLWATPIPIIDYEWQGDSLVTHTAADDLAAAPAYPWGHLPTASIQPTRIVRCRDRATGIVLPLQTYHPTV